MKRDQFVDLCSELSEETFPKGKCKERGQLLVFIAKLTIALLDQGAISP